MRRLSLFLASFLLVCCSTDLDKQMDRVLDGLEEDMGFVNTVGTEDVRKIAGWYSSNGSPERKAQAYHCLGRNEFNDGNYSSAIVSFTRALDFAEQSGDTLRVAKVCLDLARIYRIGASSADETICLSRAAQAFESAGRKGESLGALLEIGRAQANTGNTAAAGEIFKSVLADAHELADTLLEARCLEEYAELAVGTDPPDPALAIDLLSRTAEDLGYPLSCSDKGVLAYAYSLSGDAARAREWLSSAKAAVESEDDEAEVDFRTYQIASRSGDSRTALSELEKVLGYADRTRSATLQQAVSSSQREYLQSIRQSQEERLKAERLRFRLLALLALLATAAAIVGYLYLRTRHRRSLDAEIAQKERLMTLAEELKSKLGSKEEGRSRRSRKGIDGFGALERLCEQYYIYEGTDNLQPKILREVEAMVEGLRSDRNTKAALEAMLDSEKDGVMAKVRKEYPSWKEEDFQLFAFCAAGFSSTTISTLLEKDKSVVYNRVWRLKNRISSSGSSMKEFFLECMEG